MSAPMPPPYRLRDPNLRPFPTRGMPGGWRDPWDADPYDAVLSSLRQRNALRRQVTEADVQVDLLAQTRTDGRSDAHVVASEAAPARWPSVNGPKAAIPLDALEAELRELLSGADALPVAER
jgi:hypothetical protein